MDSYAKIRAALEVTLNNISGLPYIVNEGTGYDPILGTPYIRSRVLFTGRTQATKGIDQVTGKPYQHRYNGVLQLLITYPENLGTGQNTAAASSIIDAFESSSSVSYDGVYVTIEKSQLKKGYDDSPWYKTPVEIDWHSYST